jgi:hypothetical protein
VRTFIAVLTATVLAAIAACSHHGKQAGPYGAQAAELGESLSVLGWNMAVSNLRWDGDRVLVDVDAAPNGVDAPHTKAGGIRFGLYGSLTHPMEATGIGSCAEVAGPSVTAMRPLTALAPDRLTGTVCLGPLKNRSAVRGVYVYSPADRIPGSTAAYGAAFPVGVAPRDSTDTGLALSSTGVTAWRADGTPLTREALGDPEAFTGNGYMMLGLVADAVAGQYRDDAVTRGGPLMLVAGPSSPVPDLSPACAALGSSALVLPEASLDAVHVATSLCTHGEVNAAVLYATVSVIGTHAAVWKTP